jgi:2-phospho-L-lactate guanylyltransferase
VTSRLADHRWTVVLPLKGGPTAKSRLGAPAALARAIALDSLEAVRGCRLAARTVVVTPDPELARDAAALGADVVREAAPGGGLIAAVGDGLRSATGPTAVLLGDVPALRPNDLSAALRAVGRALSVARCRDGSPAPMAFVPDAEGTGTVLLAGLDATAIRPSFGSGSAAAHADSGAIRLDLRLPRLRRDVDTPEDLATAAALGIGPRTTAALGAAPGMGVAAPGSADRALP